MQILQRPGGTKRNGISHCTSLAHVVRRAPKHLMPLCTLYGRTHGCIIRDDIPHYISLAHFCEEFQGTWGGPARFTLDIGDVTYMAAIAMLNIELECNDFNDPSTRPQTDKNYNATISCDEIHDFLLSPPQSCLLMFQWRSKQTSWM